jgi:hypothetical protein
MQAIIGFITGVVGLFGMISSSIVMRYWLIVLIIMTILKLSGAVAMPWFAGPLTAGAISTGLFMLFGGLALMFISFIIASYGAILMDN